MISLVAGFKLRAGEVPVDPAAVDWRSLGVVRIICNNFDQARQTIRKACAYDCSVDVLDVGNIDYATVWYDDSQHRTFKRKHRLPVLKPVLRPMPTAYAAWLVRQYPQ